MSNGTVIKFNSLGLAIGTTHVSLNWEDRVLLGTVYAAWKGPGDLRLKVRHFNGHEWPVYPLARDVTVLERTYGPDFEDDFEDEKV